MHVVRVAVFLVLAASLTGCGGNPTASHNPIKGEVKLDGQPMESGSIMFRPVNEGKGQAVSAPIVAGRYEVGTADGPAVGPHRVEIRGTRKSGKMIQKALAPKGELIEEQVEAVSPKFNTQSELMADVKAGENVANYEVKSK